MEQSRFFANHINTTTQYYAKPFLKKARNKKSKNSTTIFESMNEKRVATNDVFSETITTNQKTASTAQSLLNEIFKYLPEYSLYQLAVESGIPLSTIRSIYDGKTHNPRYKTFKRILQFYCLIITMNNSNLSYSYK